MNHPLLYHNSNNTQRHDSEEVIKEFKEKFQLLSNTKKYELLDIGCGDGYVTAKILTEYISKDIRVMAIDKSESMINFAIHKFNDSNVKFEVMNIIDKPNRRFQNRFDFITSFFCFHWVEDHRILMENIYLLMKPGGRCVFIHPLTHAIYESYRILMKHPIWSEVMKSGIRLVPEEPQDLEDLAVDFTKRLQTAGFKNTKIEKRIKEFTYMGIEDLKDHIFAVNPFIDKLQSSEKEAYKNDLMELIMASPTVTKYFDASEEKECFNLMYTVMVGYFEK